MIDLDPFFTYRPTVFHWLNPRASLVPDINMRVRVRCAMAFSEVAGRRVLAIRNIDYFWLSFNDKRRINKREWEKGMRFGMELLPSILNGEYPKQLINAQHRFAKRRYEHEFKWKPSRKVEQAIVAAILG